MRRRAPHLLVALVCLPWLLACSDSATEPEHSFSLLGLFAMESINGSALPYTYTHPTLVGLTLHEATYRFQQDGTLVVFLRVESNGFGIVTLEETGQFTFDGTTLTTYDSDGTKQDETTVTVLSGTRFAGYDPDTGKTMVFGRR